MIRIMRYKVWIDVMNSSQRGTLYGKPLLKPSGRESTREIEYDEALC